MNSLPFYFPTHRLRDVLLDVGVDVSDEDFKHVHLTGLDADMTKSSYGASIPKLKAMSEEGDVILAYQMNGVDIPRFEKVLYKFVLKL